ncbi:MAG TPA: 2-octaprenyl-3-methyl-6-methoxy-1,4-benzoquinol hydroxylase [Gammaproteobacteria bacterium]|nr:2-octaprenyl-3-methyl-6-methoxy-1,4-benzoquinol hydroxylase [Gammaproteobacteria bacterium]
MSEVRDVLVVGGGIVGLSLAVALGRAGVDTSLVHAVQPPTDWPPDSFDMRVYAITRASQAFLEALGAWPDIEAGGISPFRAMEVWDAGGDGRIRFDSAELGEPYLGHIIESRVIVRALWRRLPDLPAVQCQVPAVVESFAEVDGLPQAALAGGHALRARLLVGADGFASRVRDFAGIRARASDYGQKAIVAVVRTEEPHRETAWQRFLPTGPLAFLPLRDGRCSIVWSATSAEAERLSALDDADFRAALGEAFDHRLGDIVDTSERVLFPLRRQHAEHYVTPRVALVGDAAHVIHPLAGQGVNLGLGDAEVLAQVVADALAQGRDPGLLHTLRRYERARKGEVLAMMTAMDGFKTLFGSQLAPLRLARSLGLNLVDAATPLKTAIMRYAMGG